MQINQFDSPQIVAESFSKDLFEWHGNSSRKFDVALSGGSTPQILFKYWAGLNGIESTWNSIHFFWGDERCVPPTDPQSNYGVANGLFFEPVCMPDTNVHRVLGEIDPEAEAKRYSDLISEALPIVNGLPQFDVIMLGMGSDGHTASIFPDQMELMDDSRICAVATHPESGQKRVTLTGPVIANAKRLAFLITGSSKKEIFATIRSKSTESEKYPATRFLHQANATIYVDSAVIG